MNKSIRRTMINKNTLVYDSEYGHAFIKVVGEAAEDGRLTIDRFISDYQTGVNFIDRCRLSPKVNNDGSWSLRWENSVKAKVIGNGRNLTKDTVKYYYEKNNYDWEEFKENFLNDIWSDLLKEFFNK